MERILFDYSLKNIPIPSEKEYIEKLIDTTEQFCKRLRWRVYFYLNPEHRSGVMETYGFKSRKSPPSLPELLNFEKRLSDMIRDIKLRPILCNCQQKLKTDAKQTINATDKLIISADKTTNHYKLDAKDYNRLLHNNVTKDYKKANEQQVSDMTQTMKTIAEDLQLDDRIMKTAKKPAFITLKDHKDNFDNNPTCRLINPTKPEIGKISKRLLENIIKDVTKATKANLWKSTQEVTSWFDDITNKQQKTFIIFDIVSFYPSITEELLNQALDFANQHTNITPQERSIIIEAKNSILVHNDNLWSKKSNNMFDITMGSFDGAESCELVGLFILHIINKELDGNFGLYRDDGLGAIRSSPRQAENLKKKLCAIFRRLDLKITVETNKNKVDYLDITLDIKNGTYSPYSKPNNIISYVNKKSNHPPNILSNIPESINKRLSTISTNQTIFNAAKPQYQQALEKSGYDYQLKYKEEENNTTQNPPENRRKRNVTWYNPPYSKNVKTNIGRKFLSIISEEFGNHPVLKKLLNKNTVKISYSCMPNMKKIIERHNRSTLEKNKDQDQDTNNDKQTTCNCRKKNECPLNNQCQTSCIIYQATVTSKKDDSKQTYIGLTATSFKTRYSNHKASFTHRTKQFSTELSKHIWKLKDQEIDYTIDWKIITRTHPYSTASKRCALCTAEKFYIVYRPHLASLNDRRELVTTCRHSSKHLLCN